jgi:undecaprenyl-phosphate galactose phosphotransferase/putative colanic acid biosynthesis UDP-glucose lipid carrier transferase
MQGRMDTEFTAASREPFLGSDASVGLDLGCGRSRVWSFFKWIPYKAIGQFTGTLDYALIVSASVAAGAAYHSLILQGDIPDLMPYLASGNLVAAIFIFGFASRGHYSPSAIASARRQVRSIVFFWSLAFLSLALFLFLVKSGAAFSRGTVIIFGAGGLVALLVSHRCISATFKRALEQGTIAGDRAITIGDRDAVMALSQASILQNAGAREVRRYLLPLSKGSGHVAALRVIEEAILFARSNRVDCILLALQWSDAHRRDLICERLRILPIRVMLLPDQHVDSIFSGAMHRTRDFTIELQRPPLSLAELALKRALDLALAGALLIALVPVFLVVAILIKLESRGPVIFSQRRKGFNGHEFKIFKFRTMNVLEDGQVVRQAQRNDPRVTRVGWLLRTTSIDELPQLLNVLRGQMSLVGPRPHAIAHDDGYNKLIANYAFRQHVKPGLTGWAQVNGYRGETTRLELMERRIDCDLWYIRNWSFWLDLRILALTGIELLKRRNAY